MKKLSTTARNEIAAAAKVRWAKIKAAHPNSANAVGDKLEVIKPVKMTIAPTLKDGTDAKTAKTLGKLYSDAQNGMRRIVALGLFAWEVKETKLKHGEFGAWLLANCPKLATEDSVTGKPRASRALSGYMDLTKSVLENCGYPTIEKYLETAAKCANDAHLGAGKFLLIADKKVPEDLKSIHEKICALVDGKTQRALFSEFKQAVDDGDGVKKQHGRLPQSSGLTKEMRELAAQREEEERLTTLEQETQDTTEWLLKNADAKNLGMMDSKLLVKLQAAAQTASGFITRLIESRSASRTGHQNGGGQ